MQRLFTFGCSFTKYDWPTWADFFGLEFEHSENWGCPGVGNVAIANRIAECHSKNIFNSNDIVVVQWSSHLRNDYHRFRSPPRGRDSLIGWKTKGSIFNYLNNEIYDKKWILNFFDEKSYVMYSLNSMLHVKNLLENTGCKWVMTSIGHFENLGTDFLEAAGYNESDHTTKNLWKDYPEFEHYRSIWDKTSWVEPIGTYAWRSIDQLYTWKDPDKDNKPWVDPHPSAQLHVNWLQNVLKPKLNISTELSAAQHQWLNACRETKQSISHLDEFSHFLSRVLLNYDKSYKGY